jgi:hypothetical protein
MSPGERKAESAGPTDSAVESCVERELDLTRSLLDGAASLLDIQGLHARRAAAACQSHARVLVLHRRKLLEAVPRRGSWVSKPDLGSWQVGLSLAVGTGLTPIGVLAADSAPHPDRAAAKARFWQQVHECERLLSSAAGRAIHVLGQGSDAALLDESIATLNFVVRMEDGSELARRAWSAQQGAARCSCILRPEPRATERTAAASDDPVPLQDTLQEASLLASAVPLELPPPSPESSARTCHVVTVRELLGRPGVEPISWCLATNAAVETPAQIAAVVDAYRAHCLIDDLFEALETGCHWHRGGLDSVRAVNGALAIFLPVAVRLVTLRSLERSTPQAPCSVLSEAQLGLLRAHTTTAMGATPTNQQVSLALAELGGQRQGERSAGWSALGNGLERLLMLELVRVARDPNG